MEDNNENEEEKVAPEVPVEIVIPPTTKEDRVELEIASPDQQISAS